MLSMRIACEGSDRVTRSMDKLCGPEAHQFCRRCRQAQWEGLWQYHWSKCQRSAKTLPWLTEHEMCRLPTAGTATSESMGQAEEAFPFYNTRWLWFLIFQMYFMPSWWSPLSFLLSKSCNCQVTVANKVTFCQRIPPSGNPSARVSA